MNDRAREIAAELAGVKRHGIPLGSLARLKEEVARELRARARVPIPGGPGEQRRMM